MVKAEIWNKLLQGKYFMLRNGLLILTFNLLKAMSHLRLLPLKSNQKLVVLHRQVSKGFSALRSAKGPICEAQGKEKNKFC